LRENAVVVEDEEDCSIITIKAFNNIRTIIRRIRSASASTTQQQKKKLRATTGPPSSVPPRQPMMLVLLCESAPSDGDAEEEHLVPFPGASVPSQPRLLLAAVQACPSPQLMAVRRRRRSTRAAARSGAQLPLLPPLLPSPSILPPTGRPTGGYY
jgi:hypothetical protein